eukprot:CCRYP_006480-RA/>CCRYP_006480-RA protein AED:0.25 eAED:0.14 QI:0/0/0/1/1/1/2/0/936
MQTPASDRLQNYGIADTGATSIFFTAEATGKNKKPTSNPLQVRIPDGNYLSSTHTMELDLDNLPPEAKQGHVIPGMKGHTLVSLVQLCNAGCNLCMDKNELVISYNNREVMRGIKCPRTGLWLLPLSNQGQAKATYLHLPAHSMSNVYHTSTRAEWIQYPHQACFSPTLSSWCKAIDNDQFMSFPGLTTWAARKYLPPSTATPKGHMARNSKNLRSTTKPTQKRAKQPRLIDLVGNMSHIDQDLHPSEEPDAPCDLFIGATIGDTFFNTLYTDLTGQFPAKSFKGNKYVFIAYAYGPNAILARPIPNRSDKTLVDTYEDIYKYLTDRGFKPQLNISDNESERAIQTFKNHFIAGLATVDPDFPIQLWHELIGQAQDTLNLLRTSRINKKLSAYAVLEGPFNFDRTPLAPPGTKALVYIDPTNRTSWGVHAEDAWYIGPAMQHYRCYRFYTPNTRAYRIAQAAQFFPKHCKMPQVDPGDTIRLAAQDLIHALRHPTPNAPINLTPNHNDALRKLADIFHTSVPTSEGEAQPPRVTTEPATSYDLTAPRVLRSKKLVHTRHTRNNTPMPTIREEIETLPTIKEETKHTLRAHRRIDARTARRLAREKAKADEEKMFAEERAKNVLKPITDTVDTQPRRQKTTPIQQVRTTVRPRATLFTPDKTAPTLISYYEDSSDEEDEDENMFSGNTEHTFLPKPPPPPIPRTSIQYPRHMGIHRNALYHVVRTHVENQTSAFIPRRMEDRHKQLQMEIPLEAVANAGVVNPENGETLTKYEQLLKIPALKQIWSKAMCKELGRLAQGYEGDPGTDTIHFMTINEIRKIPKDRTVTYARIVVDYRPQKKDPNRVRITVGGNLLKDDYPGELTTRTADLTTSKILWNSTISTEGARYMTADVKNFYLCTPMERYQYMKIKAALIPTEFMAAYNLHDKVYKGFIWMEI